MRQELYAVLIALPGGDTLLLPNTAVAEVLSAEGVRPDRGPPWLAGRCEYRGHALPVVQFEPFNGAPPPDASRRTRITVLNGISGRLPTGQFGLLSQGYPHLVTLNRAAVTMQPLLDSDRKEAVLSRVRIGNTAAAIPDLEWLESELVKQEAAGPA